MIAFVLALICAVAPAQNSAVIETSTENGDLYCTIEAREFPVHKLMTSLCSKAGIELTGFEDIDDSPPVTVYLQQRPFSVAVEYVLGAAGLAGSLSADRLTVDGIQKPFATREQSLQAAEIAYLSTLQRFPDGDHAAAARLALADIALLRGEREKAVRHYELLARQDTDTTTHLNARLRAARLLLELEDWPRAMPHLRHVAESEAEDAIIVEARRGLARCVLMRGEEQQALYMVYALDNVIEPLNSFDEADRLLIRARAKIGLGDYHNALRDLDRALRVSGGAIDEFEGMDLRAQAMELDGRPVEAALAWVQFSRTKDDELKRKAMIRAAAMALSVEGEELGVIFLWKLADNEGFGDSLVPFANEARSRLGLDALSYSEGTRTMRLNRALQLIDQGLPDESAKILATLQPEFRQFEAEDRIRFALAYAPIIEKRETFEDAIDLLRLVLPTLESSENRTKLYLLAGEMYERHGNFEDAAAAYGGEL